MSEGDGVGERYEDAARRQRRWRSRRLAVVYAVAVALTGVCAMTGALDRTELRAFDLRVGLAGAEGAPTDVAIVAIDERTIDGLDLRYPYPRGMHARVIRALAAARPAAIAYDVTFTDPTTRRQDELLARALGAAAGEVPVVIAAAKLYERTGEPSLFLPAWRLRRLGVEVGGSIASVDADGSLRRVEYELDGIPSFGIRAAELARGRKLPTPERDAPAWIDYRGPPGSFATVSFLDVMRGNVAPETFRDKLVLVGATDPTIAAPLPVPPRDELMAGVELQANIAATARAGYPLRDAAAWIELALVLALGLVAPLLALAVPARGRRGEARPPWLNYLIAAALWSLVVAGFLVVAQLLFDGGVVISVVAPLLAACLTLLGTLAVDAGAVYRAGRRLRNAFGSYVDPQVVRSAIVYADRQGRLEGRALEASVLFCDLRGWTVYVDRTSAPRVVVATMDRFLEKVGKAVAAHGGAIFSFEGDGAMVVFGGVEESLDHADRALAAARELRDEIPWRLGVGIASGTVISGTVGSGSRLAFTVTGLSVNLAARLQAKTKDLERPILLSDRTFECLSPASREGVEMIADPVEVRGIRDPQRVWSSGSREEWIEAEPIATLAPEPWDPDSTLSREPL